MRFCLPILMRTEKCSHQSGDEQKEMERKAHTTACVCEKWEKREKPWRKTRSKQTERKGRKFMQNSKKQNKPGAAGKKARKYTHTHMRCKDHVRRESASVVVCARRCVEMACIVSNLNAQQ